MGILDDIAAQYAGLTGPQLPADSPLASLQAAQYRPTPAATFPVTKPEITIRSHPPNLARKPD